MEEPTSAEMTARVEAWRAAAAKWLIEIQKPPRDREQFQVGEIAQALARQPGRLEVDKRERRRIVIDLFEWAMRGEYDETDVLMLVGGPELFAPFLPALRAVGEDAKREGIQLWGDPDSGADRPAVELRHGSVCINTGALVLRRTAVRRYLEGCGLEGAPRVLCEWFGVETAAPSGADAPRWNAAKPEPPKDQIFEQQASNGGLDPVVGLAEWIFNQRGQLRGFQKLYTAAFKVSSVGTFKKKDLLAAFKAVYRTKRHRPPASGWPLQPDYQRRADEEGLRNKSKKSF